MKQPYGIKKACEVLRRRIRFKEAHLQLPGYSLDDDNTEAIREATRLYVESWIIPIIDCIERGEAKKLKENLGGDLGDRIGEGKPKWKV